MIRIFRRLQSRFSDVDALPINEHIKTSLKTIGVRRLTAVQSQSFTPISSGQSCVAIAKTGEGKTLAYLIPLLTRLIDERALTGRSSVACLIALPTRDLCQQVASVVVGLTPTTNILLAYGKPDKAFRTLLSQRPPIIIGTGGRLASLISKGDLNPRDLKIVVIDEVDSLLGRDYLKEVSPLLHSLNEQTTQVIAVGAAMTDALDDIIRSIPCLSNAARVNTAIQPNRTPSVIQHEAIKVPDSQPLRISALASIIATRIFRQAIIFAPTAADVKAISQHPALLGRSKSLHGDLPQSERERVLNLFRASKFDILICTDVGSRGLDILGIDLVVCYKPPLEPLVYLHQAGRTGRANQNGNSLLLYSGAEKEKIQPIQAGCGIEFKRAVCPSQDEQKRIIVDLILEDSKRLFPNPSDELRNLISTLSPQDKGRLVSHCLHGIMGDVGLQMLPPKRSILSGAEGMTPVLFVDPGAKVLKDKIQIERLLESLKIKSLGMVASSESGFIVDIESKAAVLLSCEDWKSKLGIEAVLIQKLPKLISSGQMKGRKFTGTLPWKKPQKKSR